MKVPLFPLSTVLYPGGPLPLRVFEPRYLDMISNCLKNDIPFGVLMIKSGTEADPLSTYDIGTLAQIADWYQGSDGVLGITAIGRRRFRLLSSSRAADGLHIGEIELMATGARCTLPDEYRPLANILSGVLDDLGRLYESLDRQYDDASWVGYRFAEILPITPEQKQNCLESDDPVHRLEIMRDVLDSLRGTDGLT